MTPATLESIAPRLALRLDADAIARVPTAGIDTDCSGCPLRRACLPGEFGEVSEFGKKRQMNEQGESMAPGDLLVSQLDDLKFSRRKVATGRMLYRQGERFNFLYAVRSGTFKAGLMMADGREQVSGFYMAGEVMGLDGVAQAEHASNAVALEDSVVCAISYASLSDSPQGGQRLQQMISRLMSREIVREHRLMMLLGSMNAEERLASFLVNVSQRLKARGYSATEFNLRMTRAEIGSYLGLTLETVSRTFSLFQKQKLLVVDKRFVRLRDLAALEIAYSGTASLRLH